MRFFKVALVVVGGVALCLAVTCAFLVYQHSVSTEIWLVRFPAHSVSDPSAAAAIRQSLLGRAASLQSLGKPDVRYQGGGEFEVELSAPGRSPGLISSVLSDPGVFSVRAVAKGRPPSCDRSASLIIGSRSIEESNVVFDQRKKPAVGIRLTLPGGEVDRAYSRHHVGDFVAICLDEHLLAAPMVRAEVGRYVVINGFASIEEASRLAAILSGGPIPEGASASRRVAAAAER